MRLTTFGGCGGWPTAGRACSGYLVEHGGFRVLIDPGYAVLPRLLEQVPSDQIDAVLVSHGHPDHCADLNLPSRFPVLDTAVACAGTALLAAAALYGHKTAQPDRAHVADAFRSERYITVNGQPMGDDGFAPLSRFWRTAEDTLLNAGGIAVAVRDEQTWRSTPQASWLASNPLIKSRRIGEAAPRSHREKPKVLDLTSVIAGPVATARIARNGPPHTRKV